MNQEDRDRLKTIELGVAQIEKAINGERGIVTRLDNHGGRLKKIEGVILVGGVALTATGAMLHYTKDIIISWAKKKLGAA